LPGHGVQIRTDFVVVVRGEQGLHSQHPVKVDESNGVIAVNLAGKVYALAADWNFSAIRVDGTVNARAFTAQIERRGVWLRIANNGRQIDAMVISPRAAELVKLMPFKAPPDTSKFLLSPMPGLLADVTVKVGQLVQAGERLAVIEAMKMENILVAAQEGVVAELLAAHGESLAVDQPILRFA
jgi:propionyl-CoA carboxylase alpha chain